MITLGIYWTGNATLLGPLSCFINTYLSIVVIIVVELSMVFVFNPGIR